MKKIGHQLPDLINEHELKTVVEVGVRSGTLTMRVIGNCPSVERYYCVDPWKVYCESYDRPPTAAERRQEWWDGLYKRLCDISKKNPKVLPVRLSSVEAAKVMTEKIDIVYIDAVHDLINIVNDIYSWLPWIKKGGIISGHDYSKSYWQMCEGISNIFEDDLNLLIIDPSRPAISYKNTDQGGNWWVYLNDGIKKYRKRVRSLYGDLIGGVP